MIRIGTAAAELVRRAEAQRIAEARAAGAVPPACGPDIPAAPARGPVRQFTPHSLYPDGDQGWKRAPSGYRGRCALARADAFDVMAANARRRRQPEPFTSWQVEAGRAYRYVAERAAASGTTSGSYGGPSGKGTPGGPSAAWIASIIDAGRALDRARHRIGPGVALPVTRRSTGVPRRAVSDLQLVQAVCVDDLTLSATLKAAGWSVTVEHVATLRQSLAQALDRVSGAVAL